MWSPDLEWTAQTSTISAFSNFSFPIYHQCSVSPSESEVYVLKQPGKQGQVRRLQTSSVLKNSMLEVLYRISLRADYFVKRNIF